MIGYDYSYHKNTTKNEFKNVCFSLLSHGLVSYISGDAADTAQKSPTVDCAAVTVNGYLN